MNSKAWENQAASLIEVQKFGGDLEKQVRKTLGWGTGRAIYDHTRKYRIQIDCAYPDHNCPETIVSVTYSNPDTPGHSNENKLQLKLGELALLKSAYPDLGAVLVLGGTRAAWLPYVIDAFTYFFDEVLFLWDLDGAKRLKEIAHDPATVARKHKKFWADLRASWKNKTLSPVDSPVPIGLVRYAILDELIKSAGASKPMQIPNEIARHCMAASHSAGATEWQHFVNGRWAAIEMSRTFFNPVEAATDLLLTLADFDYKGGLAKDVEIPSFLHQLGMGKTKLSEDFVLHSEELNQPLYIQCKASGGGRQQHGKNIQNRTKEQVARGILYTASLSSQRALTWNEKQFHWICVLDGNWDVTKSERHKYVHMLELAGYDKVFAASDLLNPDLSLKKIDNPLVQYLSHLKCSLKKKAFETKQ
jgi:hypothetical protein